MKRDNDPPSILKEFSIFLSFFEPIFIFSDKLYGASLLKVSITQYHKR